MKQNNKTCLWGLFSTLAMFVICLTFVSARPTEAQNKAMTPVLLGDVTCDGILNTGDAVVLLKYCNELTEWSNEYQTAAADVNQNSHVNTGDCILVLRTVIGIQEEQWIEIGQPGDEYIVTLRFFDAFNKESIGDVEYIMLVAEGTKSLTINNDNFSDYIVGYRPYNMKFLQDFTMANGVITPSVIECSSVYRYELLPIDEIETEHIVVTTRVGLTESVRNNMMGNYVLGKDIDLTLTPWQTLGWHASTYDELTTTFSGEKFTGVFDGADHYIFNLQQKYGKGDNGSSFVGLFAYNAGTIKNLTLGIDYVNGATQVGALVARNAGVVSNVHVKPTSYNGAVEATRLEGSMYPGTGGVVGFNEAAGTIERCSNSLKYVCGSNEVGGICGSNYGLIEECWSTSGINTKIKDNILAGAYYDQEYHFYQYYNYAGGLCGMNYGTVRNCYVDLKAEVVASGFVGGFVCMNYTDAILENCWIKENGMVKWCTNPESYLVAVDMGGCSIYGETIVNECYAIGSDMLKPKYFTRITEEQISSHTDANPMPGWDIDIWDFGTTTELPYLRNNPQT